MVTFAALLGFSGLDERKKIHDVAVENQRINKVLNRSGSESAGHYSKNFKQWYDYSMWTGKTRDVAADCLRAVSFACDYYTPMYF